MRKLHTYLDKELKGVKTTNEEAIKKAISQAYTRIENDWYELTKQVFDKGYPSTAYVGSCALVAVVIDNKLYVANAGDSKAVVLNKKEDGTYEHLNVSKTFNANKSYEQERLKKLFKDESDIVVCKRDDMKACYVKGNLMPSRALGDLRLKKAEFNQHSFAREYGYRQPIPKFNGPYITHEPEIQVIPLSKDAQWLILASDGLWDEIKRKNVPQILVGKENQENKRIAAM